MKWQALWKNFVIILVVFFSQIITFRLFGTHILGNSVGRYHKDLLNQTDLKKNCSRCKVHFSRGYLLGIFSTIFHSTWGRQECLKKGFKSRHKTSKNFTSTQSLYNYTQFPIRFFYLMFKRQANNTSKTEKKWTS